MPGHSGGSSTWGSMAHSPLAGGPVPEGPPVRAGGGRGGGVSTTSLTGGDSRGGGVTGGAWVTPGGGDTRSGGFIAARTGADRAGGRRGAGMLAEGISSSPLPRGPWALSMTRLSREGAVRARRPQPLTSLPHRVGVPQVTWMQSSACARTEVSRTVALIPRLMPCEAWVRVAPSMTVPRPPRTRMPYQAPSAPCEVNSTGSSAVPRTSSVPSTMSSTRLGSTPDPRASSEAAITCTPGSRVSFVPQGTVTSPCST